MARCVEQYVPKTGPVRIVDLGSRNPRGQGRTHRELFDRDGCEYIGVDVVPGPNVDLVMTKPYRLPLRSSSVDTVVSGQAFEHIPFVWVSMTEIARVLRPGGHALITAPSRGHVHGGQDCWRFYPDGMRALAAWSGLELREASTDFPARLARTRRHDYSAIDPASYWGDTVGVFRKPAAYPRVRMAVVRPLMKVWANHVRGIEAACRR
jgi:SAM-dependent methyltransferase